MPFGFFFLEKKMEKKKVKLNSCDNYFPFLFNLKFAFFFFFQFSFKIALVSNW